MEKETQISESRYKDLYENSPDLLVSVDAKSARIIQCNNTLSRATGYSKEEIIGKPILEMYQPDCVPKAEKVLQQFRETGKVRNEELQLQCKDGSILEVILNVDSVKDEQGNILYSRSSWRDITDRKKAEEALRESEERFKGFFANSAAGLVVHDKDLRYVAINQALADINGVSVEYPIGKTIKEVVPDITDEIEVAFRKILETGQPLLNVETSGETQKEPGVIRHWVSSYSALFDQEGNPEGIAGIVIEETERKQAQEDLQTKTYELSERIKELNCLYGISRLVETPDISLDGILQGTVDLIPPSWQYPEIACARIILNDQEFKTENCAEPHSMQSSSIIVHGQDAGSVAVGYLEERPEIYEGPFLKEERSLIDAISERIGRIIERKKAEETLRQSERIKLTGELTSGIAHNFNNYLQIIQGNLEMILMDSSAGDDSLTKLHHCVDACRQAAMVNRRLMGLTKISNNSEVHFLSEIVGSAVEMTKTWCSGDKSIKVINETDSESMVYVNESQLMEVVVNVIKNAVEAIGDRGEIIIRTESNHDYVILSIKDTGEGIPKEILKNIWEPFFTTKTEGSGVGLSSCYALIKNHGGSMYVKSKEGEGSTFFIRLPLKRDTDENYSN